MSGISVESFTERIGSTNIITAWPFADVVPRETPASDLSGSTGIAVGRIYTTYKNSSRDRYNTVVDLETPSRVGKKININLPDAEAAAAWRQMIGVAIALEVAVTDAPEGEYREYTPSRILAVEPPITDPGHLVAARLSEDEGYVQGRVLGMADIYGVGSKSVIPLQVTDHMSQLELDCSDAIFWTPNGAMREALFTGDIVRAMVKQDADLRMGRYKADFAVYAIGHQAVGAE